MIRTQRSAVMRGLCNSILNPAEQGNFWAMMGLICNYVIGGHWHKDFKKAKYWFEKAEAQEPVDSRLTIGAKVCEKRE